jgi:hypothetical protein
VAVAVAAVVEMALAAVVAKVGWYN